MNAFFIVAIRRNLNAALISQNVGPPNLGMDLICMHLIGLKMKIKHFSLVVTIILVDVTIILVDVTIILVEGPKKSKKPHFCPFSRLLFLQTLWFYRSWRGVFFYRKTAS